MTKIKVRYMKVGVPYSITIAESHRVACTCFYVLPGILLSLLVELCKATWVIATQSSIVRETKCVFKKHSCVSPHLDKVFCCLSDSETLLSLLTCDKMQLVAFTSCRSNCLVVSYIIFFSSIAQLLALAITIS